MSKKESENLHLLRNIKLEMGNIQGELFLVRQEMISVKKQLEEQQKEKFIKIEPPKTQSTIAVEKGWFW